MALFFPVAGGFLGLIIGSFIATLVLRWPLNSSVIKGRSACDGCGAVLQPYELVPLVSHGFLHGKCRRCGIAIDPLHWQVELAGAVIGVAAMIASQNWLGLIGAGFGWLLLALALLDLRHFWLPDRLTALVAVTGIAGGLARFAPDLSARLIGGGVGYAALALIALVYRFLRKRDGLGGGDPKLLGAIGCWLGWQALPHVLLGASLGGLLWVGLRMASGTKVTATDRLPLGSLLAIAAFLDWLWQNYAA